ncbi:hypothetical protein IAD21_00114 [Abditibacteriota bacterium]|nr:hypothetical protein IAD21_00114 [Abditibacteriota bacterium]
MAYRFERPQSPFLRALPLIVCGVGAVALWIMRPVDDRTLLAGGVDKETAGCLDNLGQISKAYALYARDYDGKIPFGVDPEDHFHPEIWRDQGMGNYSGAFYQTAQNAPFLHEILRPYVKSPETFHCPADNGWKQSRLPTLSRSSLRNVKPSSYAKFGTSYYVFTKFGFAQNRADDIESPSQSLLLFDGDLWHVNAEQELLNGLFADGHSQNLTSKEFDFYSKNG